LVPSCLPREILGIPLAQCSWPADRFAAFDLPGDLGFDLSPSALRFRTKAAAASAGKWKVFPVALTVCVATVDL